MRPSKKSNQCSYRISPDSSTAERRDGENAVVLQDECEHGCYDHRKFRFELTTVCAKSIPSDGIEAEQFGSSPSAAHSTVLAAVAGSGFCQYSMPAKIR